METVEVTSKRYVCRHIHTTGNRCGSPALTGEEFCYFHHATRRGPRPAGHDYIFPDSTFDLPSFEDRPSVQLAVAVVARRIALNQIDLKRARLLLYALRIASTNLPREPHPGPEEIDQVDQIHLDPIHGPLAPVAEVVPEEELSFPRRLVATMLKRECPVCNTIVPKPQSESGPEPPIEQPAATTLPELQAVAAQEATKPGAPSSTRSHRGRVGYRAERDRLRQTRPTVSRAKKAEISSRRQTPSGSFDSALRSG